MYNIYFDPSYGTTYQNNTDIDNGISSFFKEITVSQGGGKADQVKMNPSGININTSVFNW
jgi:hypothetical protein